MADTYELVVRKIDGGEVMGAAPLTEEWCQWFFANHAGNRGTDAEKWAKIVKTIILPRIGLDEAGSWRGLNSAFVNEHMTRTGKTHAEVSAKGVDWLVTQPDKPDRDPPA